MTSTSNAAKNAAPNDNVIDGEFDESRFRLQPFDSISIDSEPAYVVKGLIPRAGLTVVYGPPKCGKSFWVFDLSMHVAMGRKYRGHKVAQGSVVYLALEGVTGFRARIDAFRNKHLKARAEPVPFYLVAGNFDLVRDHGDLIKSIRLSGEQPAVVVIDTLNRSFGGSESSDQDMSAYVRAADMLRATFDCAVIIVHHCGHEGTRPRGHSSLIGALDAQIAVKRDAANNVVATLEKMKDGEEGEVIAFRLESVQVGADEDGEPISSCVVTPVDASEVKTKAKRKLTDRQSLALDALTESLLRAGAPVPDSFSLPKGTKSVPIDEWQKEVMARSVIEKDHANPRTAFRQIYQSLAKQKIIGLRDELVWKA